MEIRIEKADFPVEKFAIPAAALAVIILLGVVIGKKKAKKNKAEDTPQDDKA